MIQILVHTLPQEIDQLEQQKTELETILRNNQITRVFSCGLAFDYCVGSTAYDAAAKGFQSFIIQDATRSVA